MDETSAHEWRCQKALIGFFNALDDRRFDAMLSHMAPDGVWTRQGVELRGHEAVSNTLAERSPTVVTRHIVSNAEFDVAGAAAEGSALVTIYHYDDKTGTLPAKLEPPRAILRFSAQFRRHGGTWLIASLVSSRIFAGNPH